MRIYARSFEMTQAINEHVWMQVEPVLSACKVQAGAAQVWLDDVNGNHGGEDKRCRIAVNSRAAGEIVVEAVHRDLYTAVEMAAAKLKGALRRRLHRNRTLQRGPIASWAALTNWGSRGEEPTPAA